MASEWWDTATRISWGVPFAVDQEGEWRDVSSVDRGKACGCFCAECHSALIARLGEVRIHHFAHEGKRECRRALETSIYGMAVALLSRPGAQVCPGPTTTIAQLAREVGASSKLVEQALKALGIKIPDHYEPFTLRTPTALGASVLSSCAERPDLVDEANDLAIHLLSSQKQFHAIQQMPRSHHRRILIINPLVFARGWQVVCNPTDSDSKITSSAETFRAWLASSMEGRGWLFNQDEREIADQIRIWIARQPPPAIVPTTTHVWRLATAPLSVPTKPTQAPRPPDQPNRTISTDAGVCPVCHGPQDVVLQGSGLFAGVRMLTCRQNPRHPVTHLGKASEP